MAGTFTLTGRFKHNDGVTPWVNSTIHFISSPYPDSTDDTVYYSNDTVITDANGSFSLTLITETSLFYSMTSDDGLFTPNPFTFAAPSAGTTRDVTDLTVFDPSTITSSIATAAAASAAAAAASAASISRETANGVAGLDAAGLPIRSVPIWRASTAVATAATWLAPDGTLIKRIASGTSRASYDATEIALWKPVATTTGTQQQVALSAQYASVLHRPINVAEQYGTTDTAIRQAATDAIAASRSLYFRAGSYSLTGDFSFAVDGLKLSGDGYNSIITLAGGALKLDGSAALRFHNTIRDLRITRTGTAGPALYLLGASGSTGAVRFTVDNFDVKGSTGDAFESAGCYIGTIMGSYFREAVGRGVYLHQATVNHTNAISFHGGEIQQNGSGVELDQTGGISFHGTCIEGNTAYGVKINTTVGASFYGIYMESNGSVGATGDDFLVGDVGTVSGFVLSGSYMNEGGVSKVRSIRLIRATGVDIRGNGFQNYLTNSPVQVNEASAGAVIGAAPELENFRNGTATSLVNIIAGTVFNQTTVGQNIAAPISKHLKASTTLDFGSIAAGAAQDLTITVTGAVNGDDATVHTNGALEAGTTIHAWVSGTDTVSVRTTNATSAAINPAARTYRVHVWN